MNGAEWIIIARFGKPHGIKGLITVNSFTDPRDNILQYTHWHGYIHGNWKPLTLTSLDIKGNAIIGHVEGCLTRDDAAVLTNTDIGIKRNQLPALQPGEFYWHQLLGLQVITPQGDVLGEVVDIMPTGSNDVLVIKGHKRHLIPYLIGQVILNVDEKQRLITVDWDADF